MTIRTSSRVIQIPAPRLSRIVIDADKDWLGFRIRNLGEPEEPSDAVTKKYTDISVTGLGINYYLLDDADSDVPSYKAMQLTPPDLSEAYVETSQNSAGDYYIAGWIAPVDGLTRLKLGVYTMHLQAEKISGNIPVRLFFEIYERKSDGTEILIAQSSVSDRIDSRRYVIISLILSSDYELAEGSRIVFKLYARYESNGSSTTVRVYYQGAVKSRVALPTIKEILDTQYAPISHTHPRSEITDLFNTPFWDNIPDKPFSTLGTEFQVVAGELQIASIDFSKITNRKLSLITVDTNLVMKPYYISLESEDATSDSPAKDSAVIYFKGAYWDGTTSVRKYIYMYLAITSAGWNALRWRDQDGNTLMQIVGNGAGDLWLNGHFRPLNDSAQDIGDATHKWRNGYFAGYIATPEIRDINENTRISFVTDDTDVVKVAVPIMMDGRLELDAWGSDYAQIGSKNSAVKAVIFWNRANEDRLDIRAKNLQLSGNDILDSDYNTRITLGDPLTISASLSPDADNSRDLGKPSLRFANGYIVNLYTGDIILDNNWRITEYDEEGNKIDGVRILNSDGEEVFRVTNDGLYYKGVKIA